MLRVDKEGRLRLGREGETVLKVDREVRLRLGLIKKADCA